MLTTVIHFLAAGTFRGTSCLTIDKIVLMRVFRTLYDEEREDGSLTVLN
jgi:hypothetical protein